MNFDLTDDQKALQKTLQDFCDQHLKPEQVAVMETAAEYPGELHAALAEAGFLGHCLPSPFGNGGGMQDLVLINEALGAHSATAVNIFFINMACGTLLALAGNKEQKEKYLSGLVHGKLKFAFALTEPGAGSDAGAIRSRCEPADNGYVMNGEKLYTTGAADADYVLAVVRSNDEEKASRGTTLLLVPTDSEGLKVEPMEKMAGNTVASCRVHFDGVHVGTEQRIGAEHQGWGFLMMTAGVERLTIAASGVGAAQSVLNAVIEHSKQREQFGQPISRFQAVQHQIADMATEVDAMRLLTRRAAWVADKGGAPIREICMAKLYSSEKVVEIAQTGMRLLGGRAYFTDSPMQRVLRESILGLYAGGTCEIQRNMIAKAIGL